jgi:uncharacterized coiled-coil protein SlyX
VKIPDNRPSSIALPEALTALDTSFQQEVFSAVIRAGKDQCKQQHHWQGICSEEYGELSRRLDRSLLQDSVSVRNVLRSRCMASLLVDEDGEIPTHQLQEQIDYLQQHLYSLGPQRQYDAVRQEHILKVLYLLRDDKEALRLLRKISKPYSNKNADQIIRDTLQLPSNTAVTDAHTRRAVLAAWLCYLRQNVGSCFATAPAIILHDEQPLVFLRDIDILLSTGRLQRVFNGIEYSAPLSISWGAGDLRRPCLVRRHSSAEENPLWLSPGLVEALTAVDILEARQPLKARNMMLRKLMTRLLKGWQGDSPYFYITAEAIIRRLLLNHLQLTEQDLADYENRSRSMIQSALLVQSPQAASMSGGRGELCARYYLYLQLAETAFKQLTENALLKSWEFTLASFAETKPTFSRWNFYASLGLNADDAGGIGPTIYRAVQEKLVELNQQVHMHQEHYDQIYGQVRYLEVRLRTAQEQEAPWLRSELNSMLVEFRSVQQQRDDAHLKAENISQLYSLLVDVYDESFPRYFQEVYDADLHEVTAGPYDDSPAGFRLVYKYGRSNSSQWMPIYHATEFIEALVSFFIATETELRSHPAIETLQDSVTQIVSAIVAHVRTPEFLETALQRMAAAHHVPLIANPLDNLDRVEKKPWVYTSGGSMATLVSCYYGLEQPPTSVTRWVENPMELAVFIIDTLKQMSDADMSRWYSDKRSALLMHSPTHAFMCKPLYSMLRQATSTDTFTYTWVRDQFVVPAQRFVAGIVLNEAKMAHLVTLLAAKVSSDHRPQFKHVFRSIYGTMDPLQFRRHIVEGMLNDNGLSRGRHLVLSPDEIDSVFYEQIPLISVPQLPLAVTRLLRGLPGIDEALITRLLVQLTDLLPGYNDSRVIGAAELQNIVKGLLALVLGTVNVPYDYPLLIAQAAQQHGLAMPAPMLFADTNWVKDYFAFTVNPGTLELELWRMDYSGSSGYPMSSWNQWLDGSKQHPTWGLYTRPYEYYL